MSGLVRTVGEIVGSIFSPGKLPDVPAPAPLPPAPTPIAQKVMPTPDGEAMARATRRSIAEQRRRRGRASTFLTNNGVSSDTLGG